MFPITVIFDRPIKRIKNYYKLVLAVKGLIFFGYISHRLDSGALPANTRRRPNAELMLGQSRRRWANINPTLGQGLVFAGIFIS